MTEYEVFDIVILDILLGKLYQRFVLLATKVFFALLVVFLSARRRPLVCQYHGEVGVYPRVAPLRHLVAEHRLNKSEAPFAPAYIVAVRKEELVPVDIHYFVSAMQCDAQLGR